MTLRSDRLDAIVSLSKRRGFVYPSSEIYGGLRASWDYGPLGVELKNNIKRQWWRSMVTERDDIVGLDSSVILAREVWEASGHVTEFVDPLTECMSCHKRFRADQLIEAYEDKHDHAPANGLADIACPNCGTRGAFTEPRMFNGLLRTHLGPVDSKLSPATSRFSSTSAASPGTAHPGAQQPEHGRVRPDKGAGLAAGSLSQIPEKGVSGFANRCSIPVEADRRREVVA